MEIIQEIGSYAGLAAVLGLAVLSALYFSQARDVKRLREWAGRAPERTETTQPSRVVAQPVPRPPVPKPPTVPPKPGVATPTPAAAAAAGAAPAVATGPAAATPAGASAADTKQAPDGQNGTDDQAAVSQDTVVHPPPAPPEDGEGDEDEPDADAPDDTEADGDEDGVDAPDDAEDEDSDGEPVPEDFHEDFDPDDDFDDTGDEPAIAAPATPPPVPQRPTIPIGGASRAEPTGILPPYEQSRPGGPVPPKRGAVFSSPRRAVAVVGGSLLALLVVGFGVLQLTGDDEEPAGGGQSRAAEEEPAEKPAEDGKKKQPGIDPAKVRVAVLNGTTVPGLAAQIGDSIERQGFQLGTVTNFIDQQRAESVVKYAPGAEREAADVGRRLKVSQREPIDAESQGLAGDATVVVVAGADKTQ